MSTATSGGQPDPQPTTPPLNPQNYIFPDPPEEAQSFARSIGNYFLFKAKRRPTLRFDPKPQPPDPEKQPQEWDKFITEKQYSFVTHDQLDNVWKVPADSTIRADIKVLNRTLVRTFIDEDHNANYWQNQYFLFQWLFAFLALLATIFAALTTYATVDRAARQGSAPPPISVPASSSGTATTAPTIAPSPAATSTQSAGASSNSGIGTGTTALAQTPTTAQEDFSSASIFGLLTTLIGAIATVLVYIYNRDRPQRVWYEKRRSAEALRKQYFLYLMHMPPYDNERHVFALQKMVTRIQNADPKKLDIAPDTQPRTPAHSAAECDTLLNIYNEQRIREQMVYYKRRSREYDFNADLTLLCTLIIPLVVSILAGLNIAQINPAIAIVVVILPNLAGLFATFQRVYDWDQQQTLYKKTFEGLQEAKIIDTTGKTTAAVLRELVNAVEAELTKESDQWGASVDENGQELSAEQIIDAFQKKVDTSDGAVRDQIAQMRNQLGLNSPK
ncbi:MAG: DUF4231 domain-containing protein [Anaerolineae bacterium]|nr:DUF4231 domain-containing protein [Anaerolineae bacterium]